MSDRDDGEEGPTDGLVDDELLDEPTARFSEELQAWLESDRPKTIGSLGDTFGNKAFAVAIMLLLFPSALPLPTGGITHVLVGLAILIAAQMVLGLHTIWVPKRLREKELHGATTEKAIPFILRRVGQLERVARPRWGRLLQLPMANRVVGLVLTAFALAAFFAPPFSGLDTLPALGAVVVCVGLVLDDVLVLGVGTVIGVGGIALTITLGAAVTRFIRDRF